MMFRLANLTDWLASGVQQCITHLVTVPDGYRSDLEYLKRKYGDSVRTGAPAVYNYLLMQPSIYNFADQLHRLVITMQQTGNQHEAACDRGR